MSEEVKWRYSQKKSGQCRERGGATVDHHMYTIHDGADIAASHDIELINAVPFDAFAVPHVKYQRRWPNSNVKVRLRHITSPHTVYRIAWYAVSCCSAS